MRDQEDESGFVIIDYMRFGQILCAMFLSGFGIWDKTGLITVFFCFVIKLVCGIYGNSLIVLYIIRLN